MMDFNADWTIVWGEGCYQYGIGAYTPGSCEDQPTLMSSAFDPVNNN